MNTLRDMQSETRNNNGQHDQVFANKGSFEIVFDTGFSRFIVGCAHKVEKISIATELLTGLFDSHPLATRLLSSIFHIHESCFAILRGPSQTPLVTELESLLVLFLEYRSLIQIGRHGGLISSMNGDLITKEIAMLIYELEKEVITRKASPVGYGMSGSSLPISRDFLASSLFDETRIAKQVEIKKPHTESRIHTGTFSQGQVNVRDVSDRKYTKDNQIKSETPVTSSETFKKTSPIAPEKTERRAEILKILKFNGASDIRYIQSMVPSVSEKTIQRELNTMIAEGAVIRKGIKRWSTYELASST